MSDLDWDDPNYVEGPVKPRDYAKLNEKYERSVRRDAEPRRYYEGGRGDDRKRDDYGSDQRSNRDNFYGKNNRDDYGGGGAVNDFSETLSIAAEMVGKVIGKAGGNINRIQHDFNVRVKVDKGDLMVKIYGSLQRNVSDAMNFVRKQISDSGRGRDRDCGGSSSGVFGTGKPYGGSRYEYSPAPTVEPFHAGDLTGTIDWAALNKASVIQESIPKYYNQNVFFRKKLLQLAGQNVHL